MDFSQFFSSLTDILVQMAPYILLGFLIAGLLHVFISQRTMSRHLSGPGIRPVIKAALFGIPLPLCSCGVLPTAVSLRRNGASRGATTSFLIATPQTGVDSIAATYSLLGLPFAIIRPVAALVGAVAGGWTVSRFAPETDSDTQAEAVDCQCTDACETPRSFWQKLLAAVRYGFVDMVSSVGKWLVIGLVIAALITVFVPDSLFVSLSKYPLLAMLAVLVVAIPMYICATGSIPIALSLMMKGLSPGIAFVMLMAGPAVNFASMLVLNRTQGRRATAIFIGSVIITSIAFGLAIDLLMPRTWFPVGAQACADGCHHTGPGWFSIACTVLLVGLLMYSAFAARGAHKHFEKTTAKQTQDMETQIFTVKGMMCNHCRMTVEKAVSALPGAEHVEVDLPTGRVTVTGKVDTAAVAEAVTKAGFDMA